MLQAGMANGLGQGELNLAAADSTEASSVASTIDRLHEMAAALVEAVCLMLGESACASPLSTGDTTALVPALFLAAR